MSYTLHQERMYQDFSWKKIFIIMAASMVLAAAVVVTLKMKTRYYDGALQGRLTGTVNNTITYLQYMRYRAYYNFYDTNVFTAVYRMYRREEPPVPVPATSAISVPVLAYHGIISSADGANITAKNFRNQMFALKRAGWQTISLEDFYAFARGEKKLPDRSFLLTFDDGRKDSFYPVDPVLKVLGYKAVIFVITEHSLGKDQTSSFYLSESELHNMQETGRWNIQAHTNGGHDIYTINPQGDRGHFYSNELWMPDKNRNENKDEFSARVNADFVEAKRRIEDRLSASVSAFAFPFGDFGQDSVNFPEAEKIVPEIAHNTYALAFFQVWPARGTRFNYPDPNTFLAKRISVNANWSDKDLLSVLENSREKKLPYADDFGSKAGWTRTWGDLAFVSHALKMGSANTTTGGSVFLEGAYLWKDYSFDAVLDLMRGQSVSLVARYADDQNLAACVFSTDLVRIEERVANADKVLNESHAPFDLLHPPKKNLHLGLRIRGNTIDCTVDGQSKVGASQLNPAIAQGSVGFKTWDPSVNNSEIVVHEIRVSPLAPENKNTPAPVLSANIKEP